MNPTVDEKLAFLRTAFGSVEIARDGVNAAVACPNPKCNSYNRKKKLAIRLDDDRVNCWVCGLKGKLLGVLKKYKINHLRDYILKFGNKNIKLFLDEQEEIILDVPRNFKLLAPLVNSSEFNVQLAVNYLKSRNVTVSDMWYFKFGISDAPELKRRVIMPSFDSEGELNFYTGRAIDKATFRKYMNCDAQKKAIIFNELNIDWSEELTLVEGPFDLIKCDHNSTCLLGSSLSEDSKLFGQIYQHKTPIVLALDHDMEIKAWQRIARLLSKYDIPVRVLELGKFHDVGEMTRKQFLEAKKEAVQWDRVSALRKKIQSLCR